MEADKKSNKKSNKKKKKPLRKLLLAAGILLIGAGIAYAVNAEQYKEKFMPGIEVNGIDVAEQGVEEVADELQTKARTYTLTLKFMNDQTEIITSADIDLAYNCGDELQTILDSQNRYVWLAGALGESAAFSLETDITFDEEKLREIITSLPETDPDRMTAPVDANLKLGDDLTFSIVPETNGNTIDIDKLIEACEEAIRSGQEDLNVVTADGIYIQPEYRSQDEELVDRMNSLNAFTGQTVTVHLSNNQDQVLDRTTLIDWVGVNDDGLYVIDEDKIREKSAEYIASLAASDDNYGYFRDFDSTYLGTVKLSTEALHGHKLDQEKMTENLVSVLLAEGDGEISAEYSVFIDDKDSRFGGTYIEVDIYDQHVFYYIDYELYYDCSCVTGLEGSHSTPSGIFAIENLEQGRTLEGYNSDGSLSYSAYVNYWMCFYPSYGLHDASWRDSFGGSIYTYDGSHGCVNLSTYSAGVIYNALEYDTPVIIFRGSDDVVIPEDEIQPADEVWVDEN